MKFILCNDIHLTSHNPEGRLDNVLETSKAKWAFILELSHANNAPILVAGDLCERPRDWYLLPFLTASLREHPHPVFVVYGQHDMYMRNEESRDATTLGVLAEAGLVTIAPNSGIVHAPLDEEEEFVIYGCNWGDVIPLPRDPSFTNILLVHAPIAMDPAWAGHVYTDATEFIKHNPGWSLVAVGDVHRKFELNVDGCTMINTGPIVRVEADEYNLNHIPQVALYNSATKRIDWHRVPALPGAEVLTRGHIEKKQLHDTILADFVAMVKQPRHTRGMPMIERVRVWVNANKNLTKEVQMLEEICGLTKK